MEVWNSLPPDLRAALAQSELSSSSNNLTARESMGSMASTKAEHVGDRSV